MTAAADQVVFPALVPALIPKVMFDAPLVSKLTRMFSMDCAVRAQKFQACRNALVISGPVVSNIFAGKSVRLELLYQPSGNRVPLEKSSAGKVVMAVDLHKLLKSVPFDVLIDGMLVSPVQLKNMPLKFVPEEVSINGKLARLEQSRQAVPKLATPLVTSNGHTNDVMLDAPRQAAVRSVPKSAPGPIVTEVI